MERTVKSVAELEEFSKEFLDKFPTHSNKATVVGLSGQLGSGKTAFTKALARALGVKEEILSPTFVIAKFYEIPKHHSWSRLVHVDAYRIENERELELLRWSALLADPHNLVLVEWPEKIGSALPPEAPILTFRFVDETTRVIS